MPDYQNGKIYKIESLIGNCVYYGSTTNKYLSVRLAKHRQDMKNNINITSKQVLQYDDARIYLVELYPCDSRDELNAREGWYIKNNECVNKNIAGRTIKQWREDNVDEIRVKKKRYYVENIDEIKRYYVENRDKINRYRVDNKEKLRRKTLCECGTIYQHYDKSRHIKSHNHIQYFDNPLHRMKL
jgi:hypothetical protein